MTSEKPTLLDWLNLKSTIDYASAPWMGAIIGAILLVIAVSLILFGLYALVMFYGAFVGFGPFSGDATGAAVRNIGLVLVALFGAPFLVWRAMVAQKQVNVAEQGHITDRINEAVKGLGAEKIAKKIHEIPRYKKGKEGWKLDDDGNPIPAERPDGSAIIDRELYEETVPNLEVRIGAIYALERIAKDSLRDHIQIMEILCAYIRENAPVTSLEPTKPPFHRAVPRTDIQAAITIIGRRSKAQIELEWEHHFRLDLRKTDLSGVDFADGNYSATIFKRCRLEFSSFRRSRLHGAQFFEALLNYSDFFKAKLRGTRFDHATINMPEVTSGGMSESINQSKIYGISVVGADLTAIDYLGETDEMNLVFGSRDTKLCHKLEFVRDKFQKPLLEIRRLKKAGKIEEAREKEEELYKNNGFAAWVPFSYHDGMTNVRYREFLNRLGLTGWPYQ